MFSTPTDPQHFAGETAPAANRAASRPAKRSRYKRPADALRITVTVCPKLGTELRLANLQHQPLIHIRRPVAGAVFGHAYVWSSCFGGLEAFGIQDVERRAADILNACFAKPARGAA